MDGYHLRLNNNRIKVTLILNCVKSYSVVGILDCYAYESDDWGSIFWMGSKVSRFGNHHLLHFNIDQLSSLLHIVSTRLLGLKSYFRCFVMLLCYIKTMAIITIYIT